MATKILFVVGNWNDGQRPLIAYWQVQGMPFERDLEHRIIAGLYPVGFIHELGAMAIAEGHPVFVDFHGLELPWDAMIQIPLQANPGQH